MKVLVCGADGFIGRALCERIEREGHCVIRGRRHASGPDELSADYSTDIDPEPWRAKLAGIDVVVNAVGILVERGAQTFDAIHRRAPCALFSACVAVGVRQVIQISALGAQRRDTAYFDSKCAADEYLLDLPIDAYVVRPALVYGRDGKSAAFFRMLASLPVHVLPAGGRQRVSPVHIDDLADVVARLLRAPAASLDHRCIDVAGATQIEYREMLSIYRASMRFAPAYRIGVPRFAVDAVAWLFDRVSGAMLTRDTWHMLQSGNTADAAETTAVLGHPPQAIADFIGADGAALRNEALSSWRSAWLRIALAAVWLWTAFVSAFLYPHADSLAMLHRAGLDGAVANAALYGSAALDAAMGFATLCKPGRRLWASQFLLVSAYSIVVAIALPEMLIHPFGPLLKNLPILAVLCVLFNEETRS
ncbi:MULTISPECIES: SDR family oxidoreductase [Paraburkholderia]|uniref:SDR family oxidoreductase n=1 Tax=Paraburkholderia TaxID=1822464 RepID=UPI00225AFD97|nr:MULTISPECIES: SDR family oxidoreductase [Paraburkholderia]MCX4162689.1 SDR family oxidoreductase [Paraburkholderia megapolitana]MDN7158184.1 SDR family oxidoreductase [Paraburkholderia sp. CHISQ3]MDQ6495231.1 SDR family oxidoreductase [Paraburkholderia megapolitana]